MSDQSRTGNSAAPQSRDPVVNPASNATINHMGFWFLLLTVLFFYLLITTWPALEDGGKVFKTVITKSVRLEESPAYKESIFTFAPDSTGATEYYSLCEEVIDRA